MFGSFLEKLKQGGFAGKAQNSAPMPALNNNNNNNIPNQGMKTGGFIGPMLAQGMAPMKSAGPAGMNKVPAFGFMRSKPQVSNAGPQRLKPNRMLRRTF